MASIKKAMGDKEMAANLERIHNLYLDREEKPVEKVERNLKVEQRLLICRPHGGWSMCADTEVLIG